MSHRGKGYLKLASLLLVLIVAGAGVYHAYYYFMKRAYPIAYADIVTAEAQKYGMEPAMIYAIIRTESNFRPSVVSDAGAVGLMQVMPDTFEWLQKRSGREELLDKSSLTDPQVNIQYGVYLLSVLVKEYTNEKTALSAYNAGMGTVGRWLADDAISSDGITLETIPYEETGQYVDKVLKSREMYRKLYF